MITPTTPCRIWHGAKNSNGYGCRRHEGRTRYVHVLAYEAIHGPVPDGLELDHLCRNPACFAVEHLEAVTHAENMRRGSGTKLTPALAAEIREAEGSVRELGRRYGVHNSTIARIRTGEMWAA